jgi:hypothetical protein
MVLAPFLEMVRRVHRQGALLAAWCKAIPRLAENLIEFVRLEDVQ